MSRFVVVGCAYGVVSDAVPYTGPMAETKAGAIQAWADMARNNGELVEAVAEGAVGLATAGVGEVVFIYGGDEALVVQQMEEA